MPSETPFSRLLALSNACFTIVARSTSTHKMLQIYNRILRATGLHICAGTYISGSVRKRKGHGGGSGASEASQRSR